MRSKSRIPEEEKLALLPPCVVCSAKSSGLHFGVNTCEACKAFFRRCLNRRKDSPLTCIGTGSCPVDIKIKVLCSSCRFEKCVQAGMSKRAIKTGRYSLERKAHLIREAKANKDLSPLGEPPASSPHVPSGDILCQPATASSILSAPTHSEDVVPFTGPPANVVLTPNLEMQPLQQTAQSVIETRTLTNSKYEGHLSQVQSPDTSFYTLTPSSSPLVDNLVTNYSTSPAPEPSSLPASEPSSLPAPEAYRAAFSHDHASASTSHDLAMSTSHDLAMSTSHDLDLIIQQVATAYQKYAPYNKEMIHKIKEAQSLFQKEQSFMEELFGPLRPLGREEYIEVYSNTGIDVDGRKELATKLRSHVDNMIHRLINFVKHIPYFNEINIDDQIELIRGGSIDWWIITSFLTTNVSNNLFTFFGQTGTKQDLMKLQSNEEMANAFFSMCEAVQKLQLDDTSLALMVAIGITDPEQTEFNIIDQEKTSSVQYPLVEALELHLSRHYQRHLLLLGKIMNTVVEIRKIRGTVQRGRLDCQGFFSQIGLCITPLMKAIVTEKKEPTYSHRKHHILQAVMNEISENS